MFNITVKSGTIAVGNTMSGEVLIQAGDCFTEGQSRACLSLEEARDFLEDLQETIAHCERIQEVGYLAAYIEKYPRC